MIYKGKQPLNGKIDSSKPLLVTSTKNGEEDKQTYYFPCYVRYLIKQIDRVDKETLQGEIQGTLIFTFYYGNTDRLIIDKFIENDKRAILLEFGQNESIQLRSDKDITLKDYEDKQLIQFTIRKKLKTDIRGRMFLAPFNIINIYLLVTIQSLQFKYCKKEEQDMNQIKEQFVRNYKRDLTKKQARNKLKDYRQQNKDALSYKKIAIRFNCMDNKQILLLRNGQNLSFGRYQIAPYYFDTVYTNTRKYPFEDDGMVKENDDKEDQKDLKYFQYAHFKIPVFQYPMQSILVVFIPIWLLALIGMFTFFQEQSFGGRLGTVSFLILAYFPLISTINQNVPPTPRIKLVEILILLEIIATSILLIESFQIKDEGLNYHFIWYENWFFFIYIIINIFSVSILVILFLLHRLIWVNRYKEKSPENKQRVKDKKVDPKKWRNKHSDDQFTAALQTNQDIEIKILENPLPN